MIHHPIRLSAYFFMILILVGCSVELYPADIPSEVVGFQRNANPIAFGDMVYDASLAKVLIPLSETGDLVLVDPDTRKVQEITGFTPQKGANGQLESISSITSGRDLWFVTNRGTLSLSVIDPSSGKILSSAKVMGIPDYVRYIPATDELWVTEKALGQIEVFSLAKGKEAIPAHSGIIAIPDGPESLVVDKLHGVAYTNKPDNGLTEVINVFTHNIVKEWGNGCSESRGLALDEQNGYLFVACKEGKVVMLDANNQGAEITSVTFGGDLNLIGYNPALQHLYLPSSASAILVILKVSSGGEPGSRGSVTQLGTADTALGANCVVADDRNNVWVCDPSHGRILLVKDAFTEKGN